MNNTNVKYNEFLGEKYTKISHKSGLDVYVFPKKLSTTFAVFGTKYGSIDNKFRIKGEEEFTEVPNGIAHFLEHKLFDNENGPDTFSRYAETGANANAFTSFEKTAYLFSCTENFKDSLEILLDFVSNPYFTDKTVEKEQGIIGQEIKMGEDNPGRVLFFNLMEAMYEKHPVKISIAGTVDSIAKINADLLYKCYNTFYNLYNMVLCVCGDVEVDEVISVCDKMLKKSEKIEIERYFEQESDNVVKDRINAKMQVAKPLFDIGIKDNHIPKEPKDRLRRAAGMAVLDEILFSKSSKIFNELYQEGLISSNFDYCYTVSESFAFNEISGESGDPEKVYSRIKSYIKEVQKYGLDRDDFERCRKVVFADFIKGFDSTEDIACELMSYIFEGCDLFDYSDVIRKLTFEDVEKLLSDMFNDEFFAMSTVCPID